MTMPNAEDFRVQIKRERNRKENLKIYTQYYIM